MSQFKSAVLSSFVILVQGIPFTASGQTTTPAPGFERRPSVQVAPAPAPGSVPTSPSAVPAQPTAAPQAQPTAPQAQPTAPQAQPTAPQTAPPFVVPQGYMLVPVGTPTLDAEARRELAKEREEEMIDAYREGDPVPAGYRTIQEPRRGLVISGAIVGGISYGLSVVGAIGADFEDKTAPLMIPVLGPWIMLAMGGAKDKQCDSNSNTLYFNDYDHCGDRSGLRAALALDGLTQAAGAVLLTVGLAYPRVRLVRKNFEVGMSPMPLGRDGYGFGALGSF